jgi:hypothetical protein
MPRPERYKDVLERVLEVTTHPSVPTTVLKRNCEVEKLFWAKNFAGQQ